MYRAAVITLSDSGYAGTREDKSGPVIQELVSAAGYELAHVSLLPDDPERLKAALIDLCDGGKADLILTTGGTGFSPRDCTPEATMAVVERPAPGIAVIALCRLPPAPCSPGPPPASGRALSS